MSAEGTGGDGIGTGAATGAGDGAEAVAARRWDAVVIGGGPAGATAAALLAERGRAVLLLEKSDGPRLKVGESLMPATYWTLERLGLLERMRASAFPKKYSVQFFAADGRASAPFYFFEADDHDSSRTWQVLRSDFDRLLLDNAAARGAVVRFGSPVAEVLFEGGDGAEDGREPRAVGVRAALDGGPAREVAARVVIDASGQNALIARSLGIKDLDPRLRHAAYWTHYRGARRDPGIDEGATLILHTEGRGGWFWFIPLPDDRASVGVVAPVEELVGDGDPEAAFARELARCPALAERLAGAEKLMPIKVARDFSYLARRIAGDGWVLTGDAFGFLDPIYSSGVFLALESGAMAADAVAAALDADDPSAARLGAHGERLAAGIRAIRRVVYAFYDPGFSFGRFLARFPEQRQAVVDLLTGNVFRKPVDGLIAALDAFAPNAESTGGAAPGGPASEDAPGEVAEARP